MNIFAYTKIIDFEYLNSFKSKFLNKISIVLRTVLLILFYKLYHSSHCFVIISKEKEKVDPLSLPFDSTHISPPWSSMIFLDM